MKRAAVLFLSLLFLWGCRDEKELSVNKLPHFVYGEIDSPGSLDPRYHPFDLETRFFLAVFEGLVTYDPETLDPIPGAAESWEISEDGLIYTFHLRDDAKWSDGSPVTAHQFVHTWIDRFSPDSDYSDYNYMTVIKGLKEYSEGDGHPDEVGITAIDETTLQIELAAPTPYFLSLLLTPTFLVLPLAAIEKYGEDWTDPENFLGNGPFKVESHIEKERVVLVKSGTYWDSDSVKLGKITVHFIEDTDQLLEMYLAGELDWISYVPADQVGQLLSRPDFHLNPTFITYYYQLNTKKPPFDDVRVRKALALTVNRRKLIHELLKGTRSPAFSLTPPIPAYGNVRPMEENPQKARELLAEAGFPGGEGSGEIPIIFNDTPGHLAVAEFLTDNWRKELGLSFSLNPLEWGEFVQTVQEKNFTLRRSGWYGDYLDPNAFLDLYVSHSQTNWVGMSNPRYDELLNKAGKMPYGEERFAILREAEEILLHEEVPVIPLYFYMNENCIDTTIWGGWYENVMDWHPWKWIFRKEK